MDVQPQLADIIIDPEFENLCPPLNSEENKELTISIEQEGFRDKIIVWNSASGPILIDGHNRYRIWDVNLDRSRKKRPEIDSRTFASRDDAKRFAIRCQLGRRNITDMQRAELALLLAPLIAKKAEQNRREHGGTAPGKSLPIKRSEVFQPIDTRAEVAKIAGVSERTLQTTKKILDSKNESVIDAARKGEMSLTAAARAVAVPKKQQESPQDDYLKRAKERFAQVHEEVTSVGRVLKGLSHEDVGIYISTSLIGRVFRELREALKVAVPVAKCQSCGGIKCLLCRETGYVTAAKLED